MERAQMAAADMESAAWTGATVEARGKAFREAERKFKAAEGGQEGLAASHRAAEARLVVLGTILDEEAAQKKLGRRTSVTKRQMDAFEARAEEKAVLEGILERRAADARKAERKVAKAKDALERKQGDLDKAAHTMGNLMRLLYGSDAPSALGRRRLAEIAAKRGTLGTLEFALGVHQMRRMQTGDAGFQHTHRRLYKAYVREEGTVPAIGKATRAAIAEVLDVPTEPARERIFDEAQAQAHAALRAGPFHEFMRGGDGGQWLRDCDYWAAHANRTAVVLMQAVIRAKLVRRKLQEKARSRRAPKGKFEMGFGGGGA